MTRDDIINLMQQACDPDKKPAWHNDFWTITQEELERFAALVAAAEREACAKAVEAEGQKYWGPGQERAACDGCAKAIQARGNK